jgi:mannose-6-phosphate isomerase-like protein (cupin superfamily)
MIEIHRLVINPGFQCSVHYHRFKHNAFYVRSGKLTIAVKKNDYKLTDNTYLDAGDLTTVKPNETHWFMNEHDEPMDGIEIYYPEPLSDDIVRETCGSAIASVSEA